jgi:glycosyltransferase involved in cell wall biosynthesis
MKRRRLFAVIPAYNEERTISRVVKDVKKYVTEVIVVDDGSIDSTARDAELAGAIVVLQKNRGYDGAIDAGFKEASKRKADLIFTFDADGQHNPKDIKRIVSPILRGKADVVVGIRPFKQRFMEHFFAFYSKRKIGISDPLCGLKAYKIDVYRKSGHFDTIKSTGTQLMFEASNRRFRLAEVPVHCNRREDIPRFGRRVKGNYKILRSFIRILRMPN